MAAAAIDAVVTAAALRSKPEVYTVSDRKVIVEDEFLNFLVIKMKTMSQDELVLLAISHFSSDWNASSRKALFELCLNLRLKHPRMNPRREKKSRVVGTNAGGNIQIVKTKLVSVFATKFMPDLDTDTLSNYLKDKLCCEVTCININAAM